MEFEEMQMIWDSQNERHLFGVDETGLQEILSQKSRDFRRKMRWQELQSYLATVVVVTAAVGIFVMNETGVVQKLLPHGGLTRWDLFALLVTAGSWLWFGFSVYSRHRRQERRERRFTASLRDELERDIEQTAHQVDVRKNILQSYLPPYVGSGLLVLVTFRMIGLSEWLMLPLGLGMGIALVLETRSQERLVREEMLPRQRELVALREKLVDAES